MEDKTTYRAGEMFPEEVFHFKDQHGKKWPVKVRSDLDAHIDGETLVLDVHPGAKDAAVEVYTGEGTKGLHFSPAPVKNLHINGPSLSRPAFNEPLSEIGQRLAEIEGRLERLEFPDYD